MVHLKLKILVIIIAISIAFTISISSAQTPLSPKLYKLQNVPPASVIWQKTYGGSADDRAFYALQISDGYLVVGSTRSVVVNTTVGWVLRLDSNGNAVWNKTFVEGSGIEIRYAINLNDSFLLVGNEFLPTGAINGFVAKIDNQGILLWKVVVGGNEVDKLFSAIATQDGFVVLGSSSYDTYGNSHAWLVKIDLQGNIVWNKIYGNTTDTVARTGVLASDGSYMVAGFTDPRGESNYDFFLLKIDSAGNLMWNKTYGGSGTQEAHSMTKASDGYVIVGDTQSSGTDIHAMALKVDFNGNVIWSETIGGKNADSPAYVTSSSDGGYLVAGFTFSFGAGNRDFWLFKISDSGQVLWSSIQGDAGYQEAYGVIETGKNQYVMVGWTDPPGQPNLIGKAQYDFYVVKIDASQTSSGFSSLQFIVYAVVVFVILVLAFFVVFNLRHKRNNT